MVLRQRRTLKIITGLPHLGVNIDHAATLRQARRGIYPDPIIAAQICEQAGAHGIVCHLREDRRHIQDADVFKLRKTVKTHLNLEMSLNPQIIHITRQVKPDLATIVPERRQEITTEGGLDVVGHFKKIKAAIDYLHLGRIPVSLFIAPDKQQIDKAKLTGASIIELHTGEYAIAKNKVEQTRELRRINAMTQYARSLGLRVSAGHGLNYLNTSAIAAIEGMEELNIGHSIISEALFIGLDAAVRKMMKIISNQ